MRCILTPLDMILFAIYILLIGDTLFHWKYYTSCHSPIQFFLLFTFCLILLHRIVFIMRTSPNISITKRKVLVYFSYLVLDPTFIYLTIQGIIWQSLNQQYTPKCVPSFRVPWLIWWWIIILVFIDIFLVLTAVLKGVRWWQIRRFRQRIRRLVDEISVMNDQTLNRMLLSAVGDDLVNNMNDQVGLAEEEIARIVKKANGRGPVNLGEVAQESCPICYENLGQEDDMLSLPICNHVFHTRCIHNWLTRSPLCPICRSNVRTNLISHLCNINGNIHSIDGGNSLSLNSA